MGMDDKYGRLWRYSLAVCRRPRLVIGTCVAFTLVCSLGLIRVEVITNPDLIWVPSNSLANRQKDFFDSAFNPFFRINQVYFVAEQEGDEAQDSDMIAPEYLQRVMSVQRAIETANFTSGVDGEVTSFESLCFRPIEGEGCLIESPSQYWLADPVLLAQDPSPSLTAACQTIDPFLASRSPCMDAIGTPVMRDVVFGGLGTNTDVKSPDPCGGGVPSARALVLTFLLNNYEDKDYQRLSLQWEKEVFLSIVEEARTLLENDVQAPMKVSYMAQRSVEDSLSVEAGENLWVIVVSYVSMFVYVSLVLGMPCHPVRSRYSLALTGIVIVLASLGSAIGVLSACGVGTTLIVWEVVPFLTLAIGVDNMVILSREFDRLEATPEFEPGASAPFSPVGLGKGGNTVQGGRGTGFEWTGQASSGSGDSEVHFPRLEERMAAAVSKVLPSILGAAVCEAGAFLVGALTDIPALRAFCLVAAAAVVFGFLFQVTWFIAALSMDARRVSQGRLDLAPWKVAAAKGARSCLWPPRPSRVERPPDPTGMTTPLLQGAPPPLPASHPPRFPIRPDDGGKAHGNQRGLQHEGCSSDSDNDTGIGAVNSASRRRGNQDRYIPPGSGLVAHGAQRPRDEVLRRDQSQDQTLNYRQVAGEAASRNVFFSFPRYFSSYGDAPRDALEARDRDGDRIPPESRERLRRRPRAGRLPGGGDDDGSGDGDLDGERVLGGGDYSPLTDPADAAGGSRGDTRSRRRREASGRQQGRRGRKEHMWFDYPHEQESSNGQDDDMEVFSSPPGPDSDRVWLRKQFQDAPREENSYRTGDADENSRKPMDVSGGGGVHANHEMWGYPAPDSEGYVSLSSRIEDKDPMMADRGRRGSNVGVGLDGDGHIGRGDGRGGCGGGLDLFREQLYAEGRSKGHSASSRLLDRYYLPALFSEVGKSLALTLAAALLVLGAFGLVGLRMGLEPQLAAPTDFYLQDYYEAQFGLGEAGPPGYVVLTDVDYYRAFNDPDARKALTQVSTGLAQLQRYVQVPIYSWFDTMLAWVNQKDTLASDCPSQIDITDEASFYSMVDTFLSIAIESQCCQSYGVCGAQFETDVAFETEASEGDEGGFKRIRASRLRFNLQPLVSQRDFVNSYYYMSKITSKLADGIPERYDGQREASSKVGNLAFPYSLYFVYYEQYAFIQGVALQNITLALGVVFLSIAFLSGFAIAWIVTALVLCTTLATVGLVWLWGELSSAPYAVSVNAVSVCNLVMSLGLSVEFCLHVAIAFQRVPGSRRERAQAAMKSAGASVLTGITLTKLVGVSVLAIAPSQLFRIYYFRMYMATVIAGAFQGLAVLPIVLSLCGPKSLHSAVPSSPSLLLDSWEEEDGTVLYLGSSPPGTPRARNDRRGRSESYGGVAGRMPGGALGWHWGSSEQLRWGSGELQEGRRHVQGVGRLGTGEHSSARPAKGGDEDAPL